MKNEFTSLPKTSNLNDCRCSAAGYICKYVCAYKFTYIHTFDTCIYIYVYMCIERERIGAQRTCRWAPIGPPGRCTIEEAAVELPFAPKLPFAPDLPFPPKLPFAGGPPVYAASARRRTWSFESLRRAKASRCETRARETFPRESLPR